MVQYDLAARKTVPMKFKGNLVGEINVLSFLEGGIDVRNNVAYGHMSGRFDAGYLDDLCQRKIISQFIVKNQKGEFKPNLDAFQLDELFRSSRINDAPMIKKQPIVQNVTVKLDIFDIDVMPNQSANLQGEQYILKEIGFKCSFQEKTA